MKEFLKTKGIRLGLVLLAVALVVSIAANVLQGRAGIFENIAGAIKAPVQAPLCL